MAYNGNPHYKNNKILELSFDFGISIIQFSKTLRENGEFELSRQLIRSGTSIGANLRESQNAESKSDFVHKVKIALKEADETEYWLMMIQKIYDFDQSQQLLNDLERILKILTKIVITSRKIINESKN